MPFLRETIESILSQTYKDFHLLLVDDGSTDNSFQYLQSLDDPRVEVRQQKNLGLCESLNHAIASVDSEFIARLDQDDLSLPTRLQEQINLLEQNPNYICVFSNVSRISETGREFGYYNLNPDQPISDYEQSIYGCIVHSTVCFRRQAFNKIGGYRSFVYPVDDYDLLLRFWEYGKVAVINKPLVKYRIHSKAGTFKVFHDMQVKTRYVTAMSELRMKGQPEISLEKFVETIDQANSLTKFSRFSKERGMLFFRKAGLLIGEGENLHGAFNLLLAFLFFPTFVVNRLLALRKA
jgi:glycosyltransferase involved in cell wall biosynthesis